MRKLNKMFGMGQNFKTVKNLLLIFSSLLFFVSCGEKETEIIQSKVMSNIFLVKNPPLEDSLLKNQLIDFLAKNPINNANFFVYTKSWDPLNKGTSYFINNLPDPGGFSSEELKNYKEEELAYYVISKCKGDSTKLVGRFHFYGLKGSINGYDRVDTLIYKCQ